MSESRCCESGEEGRELHVCGLPEDGDVISKLARKQSYQQLKVAHAARAFLYTLPHHSLSTMHLSPRLPDSLKPLTRLHAQQVLQFFRKTDELQHRKAAKRAMTVLCRLPEDEKGVASPVPDAMEKWERCDPGQGCGVHERTVRTPLLQTEWLGGRFSL